MAWLGLLLREQYYGVFGVHRGGYYASCQVFMYFTKVSLQG
jgi:hypothetical protein